MVLTPGDVVPYLLQRGLISPKSIVETDVVVSDTSRNNLNFKIISERGPCYLLKQGVDPDRIAAVSHEAAMYRFLWSIGRNEEFNHYLPHFYKYDPEEHILVLELLPKAQDLMEHHLTSGIFSTGLAKAMGNALGALHHLTVMENIDEE